MFPYPRLHAMTETTKPRAFPTYTDLTQYEVRQQNWQDFFSFYTETFISFVDLSNFSTLFLSLLNQKHSSFHLKEALWLRVGVCGQPASLLFGTNIKYNKGYLNTRTVRGKEGKEREEEEETEKEKQKI